MIFVHILYTRLCGIHLTYMCFTPNVSVFKVCTNNISLFIHILTFGMEHMHMGFILYT